MFSVFEKSYAEKVLVYSGLRYVHKNVMHTCLFEYKTRFAAEKKNKKFFFGASSKLLGKVFVVAIKQMLVIQFPYMEII